LTTILALFWAEVYYISIDDHEFYTNVVKPATYFVNFLAIICAAVLSYAINSSSHVDIDYMFQQVIIFTATIYFVAAGIFAGYTFLAGSEFKTAPLQIVARKHRLHLLRLLAIMLITVLIIKASILIYLTGKNLPMETTSDLLLVFFYFFLLEVLPLSIVLLYYWASDNGGIDDNFEEFTRDEDNEATPVLNNQNGGGRPNGSNYRGKYGSGRPVPPNFIDSVVATLSNATTESGASTSMNNGSHATTGFSTLHAKPTSPLGITYQSQFHYDLEYNHQDSSLRSLNYTNRSQQHMDAANKRFQSHQNENVYNEYDSLISSTATCP
jgi:hypothetical protein